MAGLGPQWTRIRSLVVTFGFVILVCGVIAVQPGRAQETDQNCGSEGSPEACAPNHSAQGPYAGEAQEPSGGEAEPPSASEPEAPTAGENAQRAGQNCSSGQSSSDTCGPNGEAQTPQNGEGQAPQNGEGQAPSANGSGARSGNQNCDAESSPGACSPNSEAQPANAAGRGVAGENGIPGTGYGTDIESCLKTCADSGDVASCVQNCAQSSQNTVPAKNGRGQAPSPNNSRQMSGASSTARGQVSQRRPSEPHKIQEPIPYKNLPSLDDLYTQIPLAGGKLQRFGSSAFVTGTGNSNELPMDLPAGPDYVLGPGDALIVNMWGGESSRLNRTIDRQGQIELPEAGTIMINGMTIADAESAIQQALSAQFHNEHVEISLGRLRTVRVYVVGDVQRPGAYDVSSLSTPLSALYAAGGPTSRGSLRILRQYRGEHLVREIDLYDFLLKGVRSDVERLLPGDTLLVPTVGPQVTVEGMVHRPAIYELNGEKTLDQVIELAGGVLRTASLKQINVARIVAQESRTMVSLQLPGDPAETAKKLADFPVQGGDDVVISQILPYNQDAVYLEGHVYRPGKYPFKDGMTITDILHSYQDVMPEPSDHAELVRLQAPDFRPEIINFNLHDALIGNDSFPLEPFDLIHVYGRYEVDAPMVSIKGEVLRPGIYPMSQGMTVAGLVSLAGGFTRSAYRDEAGLSSYVVQNGQEVLVTQSTVAIGKALDGDKSADVPLSPGDVVSIQQLAGWQDIGSSVTIKGEVEHAGSYPIQTGERLSSVLARAGGFRDGCISARRRSGTSPGSSAGRAGASADDSAGRRYAYPGQARSDRCANSDNYSAVTGSAAPGDSREPSQSSCQWPAYHQHLCRR